MVLLLGWIVLVAGGLQSDRPSPPRIVAVYEGTLPCADCAGIRTELTILAPGDQQLEAATFRLHETYLKTRDGDRPALFTGRLMVHQGSASDPAATVYELRPAPVGETRYFQRLNENELRLLDREQKPIRSKLPYTLTRKNIVGSYVPVPATSAGIRRVAEFAIAEAGRRSGTPIQLRRVAEAERQSVAGTNYRLCVEVLAAEKTVRALAHVFQGLDSKLTLKEWTPGGC